MKRRLAAPVAVLVAFACAQDLSVTIRSGDRPPNPGYLILKGGQGVDRLQLVLRNLRFQNEPTDGGGSSPGEKIIGSGPYLVDLSGAALNDGVFTPLLEHIHVLPKGYYEMDMDLAPVSPDDVAAVPALAPLLGKTFVITGHGLDGGTFIFESSIASVLVRPSTYRMGENHNNVDINIAPNTWFATPDAGQLDPNDPAQRALSEANVAASIDAYEDDNMDGLPDPLG